MDDHKRTVAGLFGRAAAGYDQAGFFHQVAKRLLDMVEVRPGMRVLDVACGTGAVLVQAAGLVGPTGLAVGVDLAEPMIAVAAQRLQQEGHAQAAVAVMACWQVRSVSEVAGTMWPAWNRSAPAVRPRPGFPTDQRVLDGVPGADLAALLLNRGGQGPANTSVMAPVEDQFAARLGVTESGEQPNGTNAE